MYFLSTLSAEEEGIEPRLWFLTIELLCRELNPANAGRFERCVGMSSACQEAVQLECHEGAVAPIRDGTHRHQPMTQGCGAS